eukprot:CAMPEP_0198535658 /NCGR_PEP_ID=MMETSP1462-20131121/39826_1 /TAXON_ID=1333877 /ORGANISM="Brandtodinium nutriculum, Strain RCC3387" /LENGTH=344 /DNA_ID=CAMNT_0044265597 /DNA_START=62 /DNA_END=1096 /DNA_ORIENTATION=+
MWGGRDDRDNNKGGGKGKGDWNRRREADDERPQQHVHNLDGGHGSSRDEPLKLVQIDALVFMQIMKHCRQHTPKPVTGQLLGLDVDDTLQVTHSYGYVQRMSDESGHEDGEKYQMETLKRLREVNVDSNTVGWYQTTHLGQFFSGTVIETQFLYQTEIARSCLVVYDSLQSAIGKPSFKALQLTRAFMKAYGEANEAGRAAMADFPSNDMFQEIPVSITSSVIAETFLLDWAISDPISTTSQVGILDVENQAFLEKNVQLLIGSLQELAEEQQKLIMHERMASRKGDVPQKGKGFRGSQGPPKQLDTMVLSQQIQNYCKAINGFAGDTFGKLYLMSNKPSGASK